MKKTTILAFVLSGLLSAVAVSANAGTLTPSKGAAITIDRDGQHIAATSKTEVKNGDVITAHKGSAEVTYLNCKQTITEKHFVKVNEGKACSAIQLVDANKMALIDPGTANLACTSCKAGLASKVATGKLLVLGGAVVAAVVIANVLDDEDDEVSPN